MSLATRPAAVAALVAAMLAPAQPFIRKPVALRSKVDQSPVPSSPAADLESALASALESSGVRWANRHDAHQLRPAQSPGSYALSANNAFKSANVAVIALEAALASDPGNPVLERALSETKFAVKSLERERNRLKATAAAS